MKFIHLSDLHYGEDSTPRRQELRAAALFQGIKEYFAESDQKPVIVITGDTTDEGRLGEYQVARNQFDNMRNSGFSVLVCPGNHDYTRNGRLRENSIKWYRQYLTEDPGSDDVLDESYFPTEHTFPDGDIKVHFIGLDSMQGDLILALNSWFSSIGNFFNGSYRNPHEHADGEIGSSQLIKLGEKIDVIRGNQESQNDKIIVYLHHHPFWLSSDLRLRDSADLIAITQGNKIDMLLFGHRHQEYRYITLQNSLQIPLIYNSPSSTKDGTGVQNSLDLVPQLLTGWTVPWVDMEIKEFMDSTMITELVEANRNSNQDLSVSGLPFRILDTETYRITKRVVSFDDDNET